MSSVDQNEFIDWELLRELHEGEIDPVQKVMIEVMFERDIDWDRKSAITTYMYRQYWIKVCEAEYWFENTLTEQSFKEMKRKGLEIIKARAEKKSNQ